MMVLIRFENMGGGDVFVNPDAVTKVQKSAEHGGGTQITFIGGGYVTVNSGLADTVARLLREMT